MTDYNFGTLIRRRSDELYTQDNSILITRVQFFAIEVGQSLIAVGKGKRES